VNAARSRDWARPDWADRAGAWAWDDGARVRLVERVWAGPGASTVAVQAEQRASCDDPGAVTSPWLTVAASDTVFDVPAAWELIAVLTAATQCLETVLADEGGHRG
jgi:hypothetical protein